MKRCFTRISLAPVLFVTFSMAFFACNSDQKQAFYGDAATVGADEGSSERLQHEWLMLHDPATGKIPARIREKEMAFAATLPHVEQGTNSYGKSSAATWLARGPWNVGGRTRAFAIDITDENHLVAGSCSGGMWRSTDGGQTWTATSMQNQNKSVSCLVQDTRAGHTNVWYYGSGELYGASATATGAYYYGSGIYKSTDGGQNWSVLPSTVGNSQTAFDHWGDFTWTLATDPSNTSQDEVYAACYGGIRRSIDGGTTWTLVKGTFQTTSDAYFTDVAVSATGVVYATLSSESSQKGIYRSTDGITFTDITPTGFAGTYDRIKIGISPSDENQVYFLGHTPGYGQPDTTFQGEVEWNSLWKYTYISGDGTGAGGNWEDRSLNLPTTGGPFDKYQSQGSYDIVIKVKPNDPNTVFIGGTNLYRSTNGFADPNSTSFIGGYAQGATLPVVLHYSNQHPDQQDLVFYPSNPNRMIAATDGGMHRCEDNTASNVSWTSLNNGYLTSMFYACAIDHATTSNIIIAGAQDNGSWYTNTMTLTDPWINPRGGDGSYCYIADNEAAYYFSIQNAKMMRAKVNSSGGIDSFARIDPLGGKNYLFINPYTVDPNNNNIMYLAGGKYLWRNDDLSGIPYASNWDSITTNWIQFPDSIPLSGVRISAVAVSETPANRVYIGTTARKVYRIDNANVGTPAMVDITSTTQPNIFPNGYVSCIAVDPNNADNVLVVFSNYGVYSLFYSTNAGTSWEKVAGNLEANSSGGGNGPSIRWAKIIPVSDGTVYMVGTSIGVYATYNLWGLGTYWTQQSPNEVGYSVANMIDWRDTDGLVVVATHSHGIFSTNLQSINDILSAKELFASEKNIKLINYPNPFNGQTTISFTLDKKESINLSVNDELGRAVKTIASEQLPAGEHKYTFDGNGLPAGIYYYTLKTGNYTGSKAMTLIPGG